MTLCLLNFDPFISYNVSIMVRAWVLYLDNIVVKIHGALQVKYFLKRLIFNILFTLKLTVCQQDSISDKIRHEYVQTNTYLLIFHFLLLVLNFSLVHYLNFHILSTEVFRVPQRLFSAHNEQELSRYLRDFQGIDFFFM